IKQSIVIAREGSDLNKQLIAYIVSDEELNTIYLRDQLKVFLPTYMIPEYFIQLDNIPLNSNGKIDKNILLNENLSVLSSGVEYYEPRNEIEMKMVNIIASELERKYEDVGIDDNFFDLGGTSLKMIKILSKINSEFGLDVKIILLFQYPTIRSLTQKIFYEETIVEKSSSEDENISEYLDDIINLMN
ncbi:phosphopantetheine-binding protein, partial [Flavobacterium sp. LC2016-13]|uniref:phosphopantetheine-binding protein n=1 Tax=Flavobacterium sp. LC2016-13 TaxID=2675875 RepID=UPI001395688F